MPRYKSIRPLASLKGSALLIYREAARRFYSADEISKQICSRVWNTDYRKKLKRYEETELSGFVSGLSEMLYASLEWRSRLDGVLTRKEDIPQERWADVKPGAFVYSASPSHIFSDSQEDESTPQEHTTIKEIVRHDNASQL